MGKFSDFPYFLLYNYLNPKTVEYQGTLNGYFRGGVTTMVDEIGHYERLYIEDEDDGSLTEHKFHITEVDGDNFTFFHGGITSSYETSAFDLGSDVYIRKDSVLHKYIIDRTPLYDKFVNLEKTFVYFGKIYYAGIPGYYKVIFDGLKNYVINALPENNRTDNITYFLQTYFDKVYHEIYNLQKNIWSMLDPKEIDLNWLNYLADQYGIQVDNDSIDFLGEIPVREWVDGIPYWLKRKGTYTSIYIIWKLFLTNTANKLRIYEMWHDENLSNTTDIPKGNFYEVPYEMNYSVTPSGHNGDTAYYNYIGDQGYPNWEDSGSTFTTYTSASPSGYILSPHYTIEIDLSYEPIGSTYIINEDVLNHLQTNWDYIKPVSKYVHYREYISPETNFSEDWVPLYEYDQTAYFNTRFTGSAFVTGGLGGGAILGVSEQTVARSTWSVNHNLGTDNILVQCYDYDRYMLFPDSIDIISTNKIEVTFPTSVRGYCYISSVDTNGYVHTQNTSAGIWYINHNLDNDANIVQVFKNENEFVVADTVTNNDSDNVTINFGDPETFTYSYYPSAGSDDGYSDPSGSFFDSLDYIEIGGGEEIPAARARGIFGGGGGWGSEINTISYITIDTLGNATDFGDLTVARGYFGSTSNGTNERGVFGGGHDGSSHSDVIDYITINTESNAVDFGDLWISRYGIDATSNGTNEKGVFGGGQGAAVYDVIDKITINTTGNASDYGDLNNTALYPAATSNATNERGIFAGGVASSVKLDVIEYVDLSLGASNATDFGDLTISRQGLAATSNGTNERGVFGGGNDGSYVNVMDYITINSTGNATDFGDLTLARGYLGSTSSGTNERGVFSGGTNGSEQNIIDYITINSTGNATDFGDLTVTISGLNATSNA